MALGQSHTVAENTDRSNKTTTSRIIYIFFLLFTVHFSSFTSSFRTPTKVPSRPDLTRVVKQASKQFDATRAHTSPLYISCISNACTYSRDARRIQTFTRHRHAIEAVAEKKKKSLFLFRPPRIYVSCVHSRLLSLDRYEAERKAREKRVARGTGNPSDGRTIHTGRGRGQFGPVVGLDRSAKRERREESKRPRERRRSLDDTVTLCAVRASRLGRGWRADERCYLGGAAMVTEQR